MPAAASPRTPFEHRIRVRYAEIDGQGVVFNAHWLTYFDDSCTRFMQSLGFGPECSGEREEIADRVDLAFQPLQGPVAGLLDPGGHPRQGDDVAEPIRRPGELEPGDVLIGLVWLTCRHSSSTGQPPLRTRLRA